MTNGFNRRYSYNFLLPGMIIYMIFFIIPAIVSFYFSFTDWNTFQSSVRDVSWVGLDNFKEIFTDSTINIAFKNTFIFTLMTTVFKIGLGLILALLLNAGLKSQNYLRAVFFFPSILSSVAIGLAFSSLMHPTTGLINRALISIGLGKFAMDWLTDKNLVIYSLSSIEIWKWVGFHMAIFLAGLQSISKEYYEALAIDGGDWWQGLKNITLPMLMTSFNTNLILALIGGLKVFEIIYVTTGGGPGNSSEVISSVIFKKFSQGYYGLSTAGGLLLFILVCVIAFPLYTFLSRREVDL